MPLEQEQEGHEDEDDDIRRHPTLSCTYRSPRSSIALASETTPLLSAEDKRPVVNSHFYEVEDLVTLKVFTITSGTIFSSRTLWVETGLTALLYWSVFVFI